MMNNAADPSVPTKEKRKAPWLLLTSGVALAALVGIIAWPGPGAPVAVAAEPEIVVYKTAACSCCEKWVSHLRDAGLNVDVVNVDYTRTIQERVGVPPKLASCHTAVVGDYWVEGHVPADLVQRLMAEKPDDIRGIAVPGMPLGSPGMEGPNPSEYDIVAYDSDGHTSVYATRQGKTSD